MGLFDKLKQGLEKTHQLLHTDIRDLFKAQGRLVDDSFQSDLFERTRTKGDTLRERLQLGCDAWASAGNKITNARTKRRLCSADVLVGCFMVEPP